MEAKERIIVALDTDPDKAKPLVKLLAPHVGYFKIGLEFISKMTVQLLTTPKIAAFEFLEELRNLFVLLDEKLFWDGKFSDIPNTVMGATLGLAPLKPRFFNVHATAGADAMKAAVIKKPENSKVLAVTILTSLNHNDLVEMRLSEDFNLTDPKEMAEVENNRMNSIVKNLAYLAQECGMDGAICSPKEIAVVRDYCLPDFLVVTPGVRPEWANANDQKRVMTPGEAIKAGADYLVIGRPITNPPKEIGSPADAAQKITEEIESAQRGE